MSKAIGGKREGSGCAERFRHHVAQIGPSSRHPSIKLMGRILQLPPQGVHTHSNLTIKLLHITYLGLEKAHEEGTGRNHAAPSPLCFARDETGIKP